MNFVRYSFVLLVDEFPNDTPLVLRFRVVHFANEFPDLATETLTLHLLQSLVEALPDAIIRQVFNLDAKVSLDTIFSFCLLD